jgi:hypothetical protein
VATDSSFESSVADTAVADTSVDMIHLSDGAHWWRVKAGNMAGWGPFSETWTFITSPCGVDNLSSILEQFLLAQSFPNPVNLSSTIKYELPKSALVELSVYDMLGREVSVLVNERKEAGVHVVGFDASGLSSGVYFYRLQAGDPSTSSGPRAESRGFVQTRKLLLLR